ncbi:MAG: TetR/AcrR family transcriptional regulator [Alcanivoracaceae bacterium]|jgi:AcrR family transcriptional regulator|nr:TetR/AcrR family transcriptional regulator [Alcanivoracaceae bacterium]
MGTRERRAREFREREAYLLDLATELLLEQGQDAITMERLAARGEYAKGTLYKHFTCREDVLCALACRRVNNIAAMLAQALSQVTRSRDRVLAMFVAYELYAAQHPEDFRLTLALSAGSLTDRVSADHLDELENARQSVFAISKALIGQAREEGDLAALPVSEDAFTFALETACQGSYMLVSGDPELRRRWNLPSGEENMHALASMVLDGVGWRPLSADRDYTALAASLRQQLAPVVARFSMNPGTTSAT